MTTVSSPPRLNDAELQGIVRNLNVFPMSPEFAMNRYPVDGRAMLSEIIAARRERAATLERLRKLPLDQGDNAIKLEDGPAEIAEKVLAFWLDFERDYWGSQEGARLKKAAETSRKAVEQGRQREERLQERINGLEAAYADSQQIVARLNDNVRQLTDSLASTTSREAQHSERVRLLESDRAELERQNALELSASRASHDASEHEWESKVTEAVQLLDRTRVVLLSRSQKEVQHGQSNPA